MKYRTFGRLGWEVSEVGYGMWGMAQWKGSDLKEVYKALDTAVDLGCNFFDTAWAYAEGKSENILSDILKRHKQKKLYHATKVPPKNRVWPSGREHDLQDVYPYDHIIEYTEKSLANIGVEKIDLLQLHTWDDSWSEKDEWKRAVEKLKSDGKISGFGISINRWEPDNAIKAIDTGFIDAVQVIYNIFDQAPEDTLFPLCQKKNIAVIARVPFDEGTLTGTLTRDTTFPEGDWRNTYFVPENLEASVERADRLKAVVPEKMTMPEMALRFILHNDTVSTTIPGMRSTRHVGMNMGCSQSMPLSPGLMAELKHHRWDRSPTKWSQ